MQEIEKILEEIDKATDEYGMVDYINDEPVISKNQAKEIIRKHMNDGWIPVEERLPENNDDVLATTFDGDVICAWYNMASKKWFGYEEEEIIAWRPLPEPYRPERSEE